MLCPVPAVVPALGAVAGRDLDAVFPLGRTLHGQPAADVDSDMPLAPHRFPDFHFGEVRRYAGTLCNHGVGPDVRHAIDGILGPAVCLGAVSAPPPQQALDKTHTVKTERVRAGGFNHGRPVRRRVVGIVFAVSGLVCCRHGSAEAPHDIQRLVVVGDIQRGVRELFPGGDLGSHVTVPFLRLLAGGVLVKVHLPILRPLLLHRLPLVGGPLEFQQHNVGRRPDGLCRFQRGQHGREGAAQLMDQKSKLCLQVPHGLPRRLCKGQQRRLAGVVGPLGQPIPGPVLGKVGIGPAVHRRRVRGVRVPQLLFVGVLEVGRNQPAFRVEITHQPRRAAGGHTRLRQVVPDSFLIGFSGQHL